MDIGSSEEIVHKISEWWISIGVFSSVCFAQTLSVIYSEYLCIKH